MSGHSNRIAAMEAQIRASQNPDVGYVVFSDVSDKAKDGISRIVQLAGGATHIEVLCDAPHHECEDAATQDLITKMGFTPLNKYAGAYQKDGAVNPWSRLPSYWAAEVEAAAGPGQGAGPDK